jgi:uncharacterized protein (UPF0333 family)
MLWLLDLLGKKKGVASLMLWLLIAIVITVAVIVIIWFLTGKLMTFNPGGGLLGGTASGG